MNQKLLMKLLTAPSIKEEHLSETPNSKQPSFGEATRKAFAARGHDVSLADSQYFVRALIRLHELGALVFYDEEGDRISPSGAMHSADTHAPQMPST